MKTLIIFSILIIGFKSQAATISQLDLYQRCHSHLTGSAVKPNDPMISNILTKRITALEACKDLLRSAEISGSTPLKASNKKGIAVLDTFFKLHANWFETKVFDDMVDNPDLYESSTGGLYFTKSMFDPTFKFSDVFKGTINFKAIRTRGPAIKGPRKGLAANEMTYSKGSFDASGKPIKGPNGIQRQTLTAIPNFNFKDVGLLQGITPEPELALMDFRSKKGKSIYNGSLGGGILGDLNYVMKVTKERDFRSDGAVETPRRWGRAIFVDFLCQDVPVINLSADPLPYVDANSTTPFRTTSGCVSCHASMDQLSGLIRNYSSLVINNSTIAFIPNFRPITTAATYDWKSNGDANYYRKTPVGKFYYRTIAGELMNREVSNLDSLGNLLSQLDDTYMCAASRYLEHFTGVKFPITKVASEENHPYSKAIKSLATELKTSQSPIQLIEAILSSNIYNDSQFLIGE